MSKINLFIRSTSKVPIMGKCWVILLCCIFSVYAEVTKVFELGPFELKGHVEAPVALAKYTPLEKDDLDATKRLYKIINDDLAQILSQYDPFELSDFNATIEPLSKLGFRGHVSISNFMMSGLKDLNINDMELRKKSLDVNGQFRLDLNVLTPAVVGEFLVNINKKIFFTELRISITVKVTLDQGDAQLALQVLEKPIKENEVVLELKRAELEYHAKKIKIELTFHKIGLIEHIINKSIVRTIVDNIKSDILKSFGNNLITVLNQYLTSLRSGLVAHVLHG